MKFSTILSITLLQAPGLLASGVPRKEGSLFARDCWFGEEVGCGEGGWCWKTCDSVAGTWCWTAENKEECSGCGEWISCSNDSDCSTDFACGDDDPSNGDGCEDCGCGC